MCLTKLPCFSLSTSGSSVSFCLAFFPPDIRHSSFKLSNFLLETCAEHLTFDEGMTERELEYLLNFKPPP